MTSPTERLLLKAGFAPKEADRIVRLSRRPEVASYPIRFNKHHIRRAKKDPRLWKVLLPSDDELKGAGIADNYGEEENTVVPGLQHKYAQTALLVVTDRCASNCRHCFRRGTTKGPMETADLRDLGPAIEYIYNHPEINNLLLSGGDPLLLNHRRLREIVEKFSWLPNIGTIRVGTRAPIDSPGIVTEKLLDIFASNGKPMQFVLHSNLPVELDMEALAAVWRIRKAGIQVLHQHPILKGVNDDAETIFTLHMRLMDMGISPMYIYHPMPAFMATHYQVPFFRAFKAIEEAKEMLPGPAKTFRYVIPCRAGKLEVLGFDSMEKPSTMLLRYHEAKEMEMHGKIIEVPATKRTKWVDI
jgi:KamA family protein